LYSYAKPFAASINLKHSSISLLKLPNSKDIPVSNPPNAEPTDGSRLRFLSIDYCATDIGDACTRTVKRMAATDPEFPKLIVIGNRLHVAEHEWEAYKRVLMARGAQVRPLASGMRIGNPGPRSKASKAAASA
jgi:hypothetical protein